MEEKVKTIDEIVKRHPSYGVDKGWSCYTGGMADTGDWYFRKMLDVPIEDLQAFLLDLIVQENRPPSAPVNQKEAREKFISEIERRLIFGK